MLTEQQALAFSLIYHEQQECGLCAVHCLNNLMQSQYFTAVDLSEIASEFDRKERALMEESGVHSSSFARYIAEGSGNMNDSGFFSIQVLNKALEAFSLQAVSINAPDAEDAKKNPVNQNAFICNLNEHWFTLRKFGRHWFDLNSVKNCPGYLSDTYLDLFLHELRTKGYSIFVVVGCLPSCEAESSGMFDTDLEWASSNRTTRNQTNNDNKQAKTREELDLEEAIKRSLEEISAKGTSDGSSNQL